MEAADSTWAGKDELEDPVEFVPLKEQVYDPNAEYDYDLSGHHGSIEDMVDRYYKRYYVLDVCGVKGEDQYVHQHYNNMFVVGVADSHPLHSHTSYKEMKVEWSKIATTKERKEEDKSEGQAKKKQRKEPAIVVQPDTTLCTVTCTLQDGQGSSSYHIRACVKGRLLDYNERLTSQPSLLLTSSSRDGFVAIIQPIGSQSDVLVQDDAAAAASAASSAAISQPSSSTSSTSGKSYFAVSLPLVKEATFKAERRRG